MAGGAGSHRVRARRAGGAARGAQLHRGAGGQAELRAAGVLQAFAGTEHEALLREVDADAPEWDEVAQVEEQLEGANRQVREQLRRAGAMKLAQAGSLASMTPEMRDALRELLRRS